MPWHWLVRSTARAIAVFDKVLQICPEVLYRHQKSIVTEVGMVPDIVRIDTGSLESLVQLALLFR
jgi:hypothetical protein